MVGEALALLVLLWVFTRPPQRGKVEEEIGLLRAIAEEVCRAAGQQVAFQVVESTTITYLEGSRIFLVVWNKKENRPFRRNILVYSILHEVAHLLSPFPGHGRAFEAIESALLRTAERLGYYKPKDEEEEGYPFLAFANA